MNFAFDLEVYEEGAYATVYTFRKAGADQNELTRFLSKPDVQSNPDFDPLVDRLTAGLDKFSFDHENALYRGNDGWFRNESDDFRDPDARAEALWAPIPKEDRRPLSEPYPSLRLYCFRLERMLLIAGNGGVKTTRRPQDDPVLNDALRDLRYVMERVLQRIEEKRLRTTEGGFVLTGDLHFNAPDYP